MISDNEWNSWLPEAKTVLFSYTSWDIAIEYWDIYEMVVPEARTLNDTDK